MSSRRGLTRHGAPSFSPAARWVAPQLTPLDPQPVQHIPGDGGNEATSISVAAPSRWDSGACHCTSPQRRAAVLAEYAVRLAGRPDLLDAARHELAGHNLACGCAPELPCHRAILIDYAQPPADPYRGGHALAVTVPRPWASLILLPDHLSPTVVHTRSWCTDHRGLLCVIASHTLDDHAVSSAAAAGFDTAWHTRQRGWLGAAVLVDVHPITGGCCEPPWGQQPRTHRRGLYHWVWQHGARLARPVAGHGFLGLRPVDWSVLIRTHPRAKAARR